ncbi:kynureninase [Actinomadura sp. HBU206391]|uniref:kynureninase n=1 Tax=Actinomadura sp. HBU206391 TaxID=2731692 RepID=UPI001650BEC0|nr:kynureninase [Actinomadura sp. HBU206391]MBC6458487.1 kynureninase [Actinomadura sp. HBU206391]
MIDRSEAVLLDERDPLAAFRDRYIAGDPGLIYLDDSSLARPLKATRRLLGQVLEDEWAGGLVRSWTHWIDLAQRMGDRLGDGLLGAAPGQVVFCDSTTVNLYKLSMAALTAKPGRRVIVTDDGNFATDRYVAEGIAARTDTELRLVRSDPDTGVDLRVLRDALDDDVAVVSLSLVGYRSGALLDMAAVNDIVHRAGAYMIWDLSHAAGVVPIDLDGSGADLAVGCTYKYLGGGPGAPAYLYVRRELQETLRQPIWGWFGQRDQFTMGPGYDPVPGIERFLCGCPPIISMTAAQPGIDVLAEAGIGAVRAKSLRLTELILELAADRLPELRPASPVEGSLRGAHVTFEHPQARRMVAELADRQVVIDHLEPSRLRFGPGPLFTRYVDVWDALDRLHAIAKEIS